MKKCLLTLSFALGIAMLWNGVAQAAEEKVSTEPMSVVAVEKVHETDAGEAIRTVGEEIAEGETGVVCCPDPCQPVVTQCCYEPCRRHRCCWGWRARRMARWCGYNANYGYEAPRTYYHPMTTDCDCR